MDIFQRIRLNKNSKVFKMLFINNTEKYFWYYERY